MSARMPTTMEKILPIKKVRISKTPRIVGRIVMGRQITPMIVLSAVADATNPQKRLMMPLVRVITAMAVSKPGF